MKDFVREQYSHRKVFIYRGSVQLVPLIFSATIIITMVLKKVSYCVSFPKTVLSAIIIIRPLTMNLVRSMPVNLLYGNEYYETLYA